MVIVKWMLCLFLVLCAVPAFAATATLTWTYNSTNEAGFHVERATAACSPVPTTFTKIGEVGANVKTYIDATAVDGTKVCYRVRAYNYRFVGDPESAQYSGWSNLAGKEFPLAGPADPSLLGVN